MAMKTVMNEMGKYEEALDIFFGMNPQNPYLILFFLYLRKDNRLSIVNNWNTKAYNVLASIGYDKEIPNGSSILKKWKDEGIVNRCIIGDFAEGSRDYFLYHELIYLSGVNHVDNLNDYEKQWGASYLVATVNCLLEISDEWINTNFPKLFDNLISRIFSRSSTEFLQPKEITSLAVKLLNYDYGSVYNPFAGLASYAIELNVGDNYIGQEINEETALIAKLRLMGHCGNSFGLYTEDSLKKNPDVFDFAISTPPFGMQDAELHFMKLAMMCTKRAVGVFPNGILFRSSSREVNLRKSLLNQDLIEMVITLPGNLFSYTSIPVCIIVLNKNKQNPGIVKMVDATDCYVKGKKQNELALNEVLHLCETTESSNVAFIPLTELQANNYNLNVGQYIYKNIETPVGYKTIQLDELGSFVTNTSEEQSGYCVRVKDLANDVDLRYRTKEDFSEDIHIGRSIYLQENALLISRVRTLKPTLFDASKGGVHLINCSAFIPNRDIVLPAYLAIELSKDYILKQFSFGIIPNISMAELKKVQVLVPSLNDQQQIIDEFQANLIRSLGIELNNMKNAQFDAYEKNMHLRKHALCQIFNEILPATHRLVNFISSTDGSFSKKDIVAKRNGTTFEEYLMKLGKNIEKASNLITALTDEQTYGNEEIIDVHSFLQEYCNSKFNERYDISLMFNCDENIETSSVKFSKRDFITVFDNIFTNAKKYGFISDLRKDYCLRIKTSVVDIKDKQILRICIANNGEALPMGMSPEQIFSWGVGHGTGLGTWQARNIVNHFGGDISFEQNLNAADGFKIEYIITLPISE